MACDVSNSNGSLGIYNGCAFVIERPELTMVDVRHLPEESCITEGSFGPTGMYQYYMTCYIVECLGGGGPTWLQGSYNVIFLHYNVQKSLSFKESKSIPLTT